MKILVIEDQPLEMKLAVHVLIAAGHEVEQADDAERALTNLRNDVPDVILLDLSLPGMDGLALARQVKSDPALRDVTIVAVTSYPEQFSHEDARAAGCAAYLSKPLSTRTLPKFLTDVVENNEGQATR